MTFGIEVGRIQVVFYVLRLLWLWLQVEDVRTSRIEQVLDEISANLLFDNNNLERLTLEEFGNQMIDFTGLCAYDVAGKSYRVEESLSELVAMLYRRATTMLKECVEVTADAEGSFVISAQEIVFSPVFRLCLSVIINTYYYYYYFWTLGKMSDVFENLVRGGTMESPLIWEENVNRTVVQQN